MRVVFRTENMAMDIARTIQAISEPCTISIDILSQRIMRGSCCLIERYNSDLDHPYELSYLVKYRDSGIVAGRIFLLDEVPPTGTIIIFSRNESTDWYELSFGE